MEEIGHEQRVCDFCEKKAVELVLWPRPISSRESKCLAKNIIPSGTGAMIFDLIQTQKDEEMIISFSVLEISVVLCSECCLKDRKEVLEAIVKKPRILEEAIESHQIYIDELIHEISDKKKEVEELAEKIDRVTNDVYLKKIFLAQKRKSLRRVQEAYAETS